LVGVSKKSFLSAILSLPPNERVEGTAAAVTASILNGANIIRVHDVKEMKRVAMVSDALKSTNSPEMP
jgi:dihydropteroate synthase